MDGVTIRVAEQEDLQRIADLIEIVFGRPMDLAMLRWALADPAQEGALYSFVALKDDQVVGHVGYRRSAYRVGGEEVRGVHPIIWAVHPDHRGFGRELLHRSLLQGDVSLVYQPSASATRVIPKVGYREFIHVDEFRRALAMPGIARLSRNKTLIDWLRAGRLLARSLQGLTSDLLLSPRLDPAITLKPYTDDDHRFEPPGDASVTNCPTRDEVRWAQACPTLLGFSYTVFRREVPVGVLLGYVKHGRSLSAGRILHLPNMGSDVAAWGSVLAHAKRVFEEHGCHYLTTMASHPVLRKALRRAGFQKTGRRLAWLRDPDGNMFQQPWHLTYLEGDVGYRGF